MAIQHDTPLSAAQTAEYARISLNCFNPPYESQLESVATRLEAMKSGNGSLVERARELLQANKELSGIAYNLRYYQTSFADAPPEVPAETTMKLWHLRERLSTIYTAYETLADTLSAPKLLERVRRMVA